MKYLVIFHTFSGVLYLEKYMKKKGIKHETMPAPRALSRDCGVALTFVHDDLNVILEEVNVENIHRIYETDTDKLVYENN